MDNFKIEKKVCINVDGVWSTPYVYDDVQRYDKSVVGRREKESVVIGNLIMVDAKSVIEAFSLEDGKKLFCVDNVVGWERHEEYYVIKNDNNKFYIFFDETQKIHGPFESVELVFDTLIVSKKFKCKDVFKTLYGIYSTLGQVILPVKYDAVDFYGSASIIAKEKGKYGLFLENGECRIRPEYDDIRFVKDLELVQVYSASENKFGIFSWSGISIIPVEYDTIRYDALNEIFVVLKYGQYGVYDVCGRRLFEPIFSEAEIIPDMPFIKLKLEGNVLYYEIQSEMLFQEKCIKLYKNKYKYFDGKWHTVYYDK